MSPEIWKCCLGHPGYEVSDFGRVRSVHRMVARSDGRIRFARGTLMSPVRSVKSAAHLRVKLGSTGRKFVHVLVLEAFIGPRPLGKQCCHADGDPTNNHLENLRWDTASNNFKDRKAHGTYPEGERNPSHKYSDEVIRAVRLSSLNSAELSKIYGMHPVYVARIKSGRTRTSA